MMPQIKLPMALPLVCGMPANAAGGTAYCCAGMGGAGAVGGGDAELVDGACGTEVPQLEQNRTLSANAVRH